MGAFLKLSLIFLLALVSCRTDSKTSNPQIPFSEFQKVKRDLKSGEVRVAGTFDLKSICLNFLPRDKPHGDVCKAYFSESGRGGDVPTEEVGLKVCNNAVSTNCIEPLPANAPPEVIVIRDYNGEKLNQWGRAVIEARLSSAETLTGVEVLTIERAD